MGIYPYLEGLDIAHFAILANSHGKKVRSNPMKSLSFPFGSPSIYKEGNGKAWEANKNRYGVCSESQRSAVVRGTPAALMAVRRASEGVIVVRKEAYRWRKSNRLAS